jgi:hypothetical protein
MNKCLIENFLNYFLRDLRQFSNHKGTIKICDIESYVGVWLFMPNDPDLFFKKRKRAYYAQLVRI